MIFSTCISRSLENVGKDDVPIAHLTKLSSVLEIVYMCVDSAPFSLNCKIYHPRAPEVVSLWYHFGPIGKLMPP